ncbi:MAG: hypothetical protein IJ960_01900 [Oscillospiraceae bacterium]|nr:hypothetical protein [Oscillospiraceae bacterium]
MLELMILIAFCGFFFKAVGLAFRMAWGIAKIVASLLFAVAVPLFIGCLMFAGGLLLLIPLVLVAIAFGIVKAFC